MGKTTKINWTEEMLFFIRTNFGLMDARPMAAALKVSLCSLRAQYYSMGLKRIEMEYWTEEQVKFLHDNYKLKGDLELSKIFQLTWPKNKEWTIKHIEKKRKYLSLRRTKEEINRIMDGHKNIGVYARASAKAWNTRGKSIEGEIRYWKGKNKRAFPVIKVNGTYVHYSRYRYRLLHGDIPKNMNVIFADNNPYNLSDDNLVLGTDADLAAKNSEISSIGLSDNYVAAIMTIKNPSLREEIKKIPELIKLKRAQLKLERAINGKV